jgi:hypothetical protein
MRDSNYLRVFPLQTPYFTVLANGTGVNTTPLFASWLNGLGMNEDTGVVFIEQDHPDNGFAVKTGINSAALILVPYCLSQAHLRGLSRSLLLLLTSTFLCSRMVSCRRAFRQRFPQVAQPRGQSS